VQPAEEVVVVVFATAAGQLGLADRQSKAVEQDERPNPVFSATCILLEAASSRFRNSVLTASDQEHASTFPSTASPMAHTHWHRGSKTRHDQTANGGAKTQQTFLGRLWCLRLGQRLLCSRGRQQQQMKSRRPPRETAV